MLIVCIVKIYLTFIGVSIRYNVVKDLSENVLSVVNKLKESIEPITVIDCFDLVVSTVDCAVTRTVSLSLVIWGLVFGAGFQEFCTCFTCDLVTCV